MTSSLTLLRACALLVIATAPSLANPPVIKPLSEPDPARDTRVAWHKDARFGAFVHWGVYSTLGNEWEGKPGTTYAEHIMRVKKIPRAVYLERVAKPFNPEKFDAEAWIKLLKAAGTRYFIITAKHHDGYALWPSAVSDFDIADASSFKRDPMGELAAACRRHGLRFGFYYSHAFDWEHPDAPGNDWDYDNPGGDQLLHGGTNWFDNPAAAPYVEKARRYVDQKSIPQILELIERYQPDILWFDTPHKLSPAENMRILQAIRSASKDVVVNGRLVRTHGDYRNTSDRPAEIAYTAGHWEGIPTTNESYGYSKFDHTHKSPEHFIQLLAKMVAKGGNMLMNVGPKGDGTIDERDAQILKAIGDWLQKNGESIYGAERTPLAVHDWGTSTRKGNRLYLHVFKWPAQGRLLLGGLRSDPSAAALLTEAGSKLAWKRVSPLDLEIAVPAQAPDAANSIVVLDFAKPLDTEFARLLVPEADTTRLHVFDGELTGRNIAFMDGKRNRDLVTNWSHADSGVDWKARAPRERRVRVRVEYSCPPGAGGGYRIDFGGQAVSGAARPTTSNPRDATFIVDELGTITLPVGTYTVTIRPTDFAGDKVAKAADDAERTPGEVAQAQANRQLMQLRQIELIPVE